MCTFEGLPEMSMKHFFLSVLSYTVCVRSRDETVPSVSVVLHRMCTLEGLPSVSVVYAMYVSN